MSNEIQCVCCGKLKSNTEFNKNLRNKTGFHSHCKECRNLKRKEERRQNKIEAINYKGGKCNDCGNVFHQAVFEFHHIDPKEKDIDPCHLINGASKGLTEKAKLELDKCVLLCANCHRIRHFSDLID